MIKKSTEIILQDGGNKEIINISGGIPLAKGDILNYHPDNSDASDQYEVVDKTIEYYVQSTDHVVNITYILRKK